MVLERNFALKNDAPALNLGSLTSNLSNYRIVGFKAGGSMRRAFMTGLAGLVSGLTMLHPAVAADLPAQAPAATAPPPFFLFSSTVLEYRFEPQGTDVGFPHFFPKQIANITHVDAYQYGTNFISVDVLKSTGADPAAPALTSYTGEGSTEVFATYRATFSGNAVTHSHTFSYGFIKDVSLEYGGDLESQNTTFAPQQTDFVVGPQLSFDVEGVFTLSAMLYKEYNHNGLAQEFGLAQQSRITTPRAAG